MKKEIKITQDNIRDAQEFFRNELENNFVTECTNIRTNGSLSAVLIDIGYLGDYKPVKEDCLELLEKYEAESSNDIENKNYIIGFYKNLPIVVDVNMEWFDERLFFEKNNEIVLELKVDNPNGMLI